MYAVIESGGKQYLVSPGDVLKIEKLDAEQGSEVVFDRVLMVKNDQTIVGNPLVAGAAVVGEVLEQGKGKKVIIFKYKRRKGYRKKQGHRQLYTAVRIKEIRLAGEGEESKEETE